MDQSDRGDRTAMGLLNGRPKELPLALHERVRLVNEKGDGLVRSDDPLWRNLYTRLPFY